eukprot:555480-Amphidinium_carterae.1
MPVRAQRLTTRHKGIGLRLAKRMLQRLRRRHVPAAHKLRGKSKPLALERQSLYGKEDISFHLQLQLQLTKLTCASVYAGERKKHVDPTLLHKGVPPAAA